MHGLEAAENDREAQLDHLDTQKRRSAVGISYEPLVFAAQVGMERHSESVLTQIATAIHGRICQRA